MGILSIFHQSMAGPHVKPLEVAMARVEALKSTAKALKNPSGPVDAEFLTYLCTL